jgi:hypothetical protein
MDWPHLYHVTLSDTGNQHRAEFDVLTWLGELNAVAMAMEAHDSGSGQWHVYAVNVSDAGPAPRQPDGTVGQGPPGYLEDRDEF